MLRLCYGLQLVKRFARKIEDLVSNVGTSRSGNASKKKIRSFLVDHVKFILRGSGFQLTWIHL